MDLVSEARGATKVILEERQGEVFAETASVPGLRKFYIESYGCQMNFSDSEIVASILANEGYTPTTDLQEAELVFLNTCSIREKAEETIRHRLVHFGAMKRKNPKMTIGILGCMAERLKKVLMEENQLVDLVVGPDAYRDLPKLITRTDDGERAINVLLSREETYGDISPVRLESNGISAFISIMRGCDNMCSFCVVPFTRGRERSRDVHSILAEAVDLQTRGFKEITLLGQNVDSYKWQEADQNVNFAQLLEQVAIAAPHMRIRFSTSHPKDITDDVLYTMARHDNICKYIHLPIQSGSSRILDLMNRTYDREWYMEKVRRIYEIIPECAISSDIITGFCSETEEDHADSLSIIEFGQYTMSYMFAYSERPGTQAARKYADDVPLEVKNRRLSEIIVKQRDISHELNKKDIGTICEILVEGESKKRRDQLKGRNSQNKMVVIDKTASVQPGDLVQVLITDCTSATLIGEIVNA